jgi:3,5-dihydroxyphenylacetyl-CoA synthase
MPARAPTRVGMKPAPTTATAAERGASARAGIARVCGLSTANPERSFSQTEVLELLGLAGDRFARDIFAGCGVRKRHLEICPEILGTCLQHRTPRTEEQLFELALEAVDKLAADPAEIGTVITATYYALGGPTLAHRLVEHYDLDPGVDKYHVVGVGCASAVPLFKLAGPALRDHPGRRALVVAAESITGFLTPVSPGDERTKTVGSALFGDGCAAVLLGGDDEDTGPEVLALAVHQVSGTLGSVRFRLAADDSYMQIGRELPVLAGDRAGALVDEFLGASGLTRESIEHWLIHPGGRGIIESVQRSLRLTSEQVGVSHGVLAEFGNMGTPSSLFVLERTIDERRPRVGELGLMLTIGPGVTVGLMLLRF